MKGQPAPWVRRRPSISHSRIEHPGAIAVGVPGSHGAGEAVRLPNVAVAAGVEEVAIVIQVLQAVATIRTAVAGILRIRLAVVLALFVPGVVPGGFDTASDCAF